MLAVLEPNWKTQQQKRWDMNGSYTDRGAKHILVAAESKARGKQQKLQLGRLSLNLKEKKVNQKVSVGNNPTLSRKLD